MTDASFATPLVKKELPGSVQRLAWILLAAGVVVIAAAYMVDVRRSAFNNIVLFLFVTSLAGGSLLLIAIEYMSGAVWSVPMRRVVEFIAGLTPLAPLVALPCLLTMHDLYTWTNTEAMAGGGALHAKQPYLNLQFFVIRFVVVFLAWNLFYWLYTRNSLKQDTTRDPALTTFNIRMSAVFLPVFALTVTVTAIDWAMSLEPHWYSTIYGVYYFAGTFLAAVACATYIVVRLNEAGYLPGLRRDHYYSLGALMFAFVNFWAYIAFSQFLLIWYANLPEETFWFMTRWKGGWEYFSIGLIIVHFAVPYFALLSQDSKMDPRRLKFMALWILVAHLMDLYWLVMPTYSPTLTFAWIDLFFPLIVVGAVMLLLTVKMRRHPVMPIGDPKLARGMDFHL